MSLMHFRVNLQSIVASVSRDALLEVGPKAGTYVTATRLEPTTTYFVKKTLNHLLKLAK